MLNGSGSTPECVVLSLKQHHHLESPLSIRSVFCCSWIELFICKVDELILVSFNHLINGFSYSATFAPTVQHSSGLAVSGSSSFFFFQKLYYMFNIN